VDAVAARVLVEVVDSVAEEGRGNRPASDRDGNQQDDEDAAADRDLVAAEPAPDLLPVAAGPDGFELAELAVRLDRDRRRKSGLGADELVLLLSRRHRLSEYSWARITRLQPFRRS